jgi:hypothetical protein
MAATLTSIGQQLGSKRRFEMRILVYKRTHTGDPDGEGNFGCDDCMGVVRGYKYDAVIGVGGIGSEARSENIAGKITWIGIGPSKQWLAADEAPGMRGPLVTFKKFARLDENGPPLIAWALMLARHLYERKARYLLGNLSDAEQREDEEILRLARSRKPSATNAEKRKSVCIPKQAAPCVSVRRKSC